MKKSIWDSLTKDDNDTETMYNDKIEGIKSENGDSYTGEFYRENLTWYFKVKDKYENEYDTTEEPLIRLDITLIQFPEHNQFFVANIPGNPIIYNRKQEDGSYRKLDNFFNKK